MAGQETRITTDATTLEEEYENQRISALPEPLQHLVATHRLDQLEAVPSYIEEQAKDFVQLCTALGIVSERE